MLLCCYHPILALNIIYILMCISICDLSPDFYIQWSTQHLHLILVLVIYLMALSSKSTLKFCSLMLVMVTQKITFLSFSCRQLLLDFSK